MQMGSGRGGGPPVDRTLQAEPASGLSERQISEFREHGFVFLRSVLDPAEVATLRAAILRNADLGPTRQLERGKQYTIDHNAVADPDLASVAVHPTVLRCVEQLLGGAVVLSALVA